MTPLQIFWYSLVGIAKYGYCIWIVQIGTLILAILSIHALRHKRKKMIRICTALCIILVGSCLYIDTNFYMKHQTPERLTNNVMSMAKNGTLIFSDIVIHNGNDDASKVYDEETIGEREWTEEYWCSIDYDKDKKLYVLQDSLSHVTTAKPKVVYDLLYRSLNSYVTENKRERIFSRDDTSEPYITGYVNPTGSMLQMYTPQEEGGPTGFTMMADYPEEGLTRSFVVFELRYN